MVTSPWEIKQQMRNPGVPARNHQELMTRYSLHRESGKAVRRETCRRSYSSTPHLGPCLSVLYLVPQ